MSDSELLDKLIDLWIDNRCERLEELCPEAGAPDQASVRPLLKRLAAQVRTDSLPGKSLDTVSLPEGGKHRLTVEMASGSHTMKATHPGLKRAMLPHGDLERAMPFEFRGQLRSQAAQRLYLRRLDPALRDKLEELALAFPMHSSPSVQLINEASTVTKAAADAVTEPEAVMTTDTSRSIDDEINAIITDARNSDDPNSAFRKLLLRAHWTRRAWADDAARSEPTISRWIRGLSVPQSENSLRNALHRRLRQQWTDVRGITFEKSLKN
jgi:hypothetical protein